MVALCVTRRTREQSRGSVYAECVSTSAKVRAATEHRRIWFSCRENMQVLSGTDSLVLLFVFILKSLLSLLFTSRYTMEAFLIFFIFDSSVFAKHSVMY